MRIRSWFLRPVLNTIANLEKRIMATELESRNVLAQLIANALAAYEAQGSVIAARDERIAVLEEALANADADAAAALQAALDADSASDAAWNQEQIENLRAFVRDPETPVDEVDPEVPGEDVPSE